jgi:LmbE family N-acetylglucosaminyl deacetylase
LSSFSSLFRRGAGPDAGGCAADVLIVAPHPDDETIGCAGITLQAVARGERVGIVVLTQGDGHVKLTAVVAQKPAEDLGPDDFIRAGVLRQGHTLRAAANVGVAEVDVVFLGYPHGGLGKMYGDAGDTSYRQPLTSKQATYGGAPRLSFGTARPARSVYNAAWRSQADYNGKVILGCAETIPEGIAAHFVASAHGAAELLFETSRVHPLEMSGRGQ